MNKQSNLVGARVRTLYEHSSTGTIIKPKRINLPMPGPDWHLIQYDDGYGVMCIHRSMFAIANAEEQP